MIGIREPKYKFGDKVYCKQYESSAIITGISDYSFAKDKYFYNVEWEHDDYLDEIHEDLLEPYIEKPNTVWDLEYGDYYFIINESCVIERLHWIGKHDSIEMRSIGNAFLTRKEAEFELERRKVETEMLRLGGRRVFKKGENNYYIVCDFDSHYDIWISNNKSDGFAQMMIYFDSNKECMNAIDSIGVDRIKKYIFGVES